MRLLAAFRPAARMEYAPSLLGTSKNLKTKTFLAAEAQSTQRKPWFFPLRTLRLCGKALSCELLVSKLLGF
jgi:hypothetical protein